MHHRRVVRVAAAVGLSSVLMAGLTTQAVAAPPSHHRQPDAQAKKAGVTSAGGGYAGWSARSGGKKQQKQQQNKLKSGSSGSAAKPLQSGSSHVDGMDVAAYQKNVDWKSWKSKGKQFMYTKATEGTSYQSPYFSSQYTGAYNAGLLHGAYHFARPDGAGGKKQADYFVQHGGSWSADGTTLPGMLDIEDNYTGGSQCYGKTPTQLKTWVDNFSAEYHKKTSRYPVIYTGANFWKTCLNNTTAFSENNPLSFPYWQSDPPTALPGGWSFYTFWQYTDDPVDQDQFSADMAQLRKLATG